jgi:hypothetical protein
MISTEERNKEMGRDKKGRMKEKRRWKRTGEERQEEKNIWKESRCKRRGKKVKLECRKREGKVIIYTYIYVCVCVCARFEACDATRNYFKLNLATA